MKENLIAINKWVYFTLNYPYDFIAKVWADTPHLINHLKGKFNAYYEDCGSYGVMGKFYANLDKSNQVKLMTWVMDNFNDEQKLNIAD